MIFGYKVVTKREGVRPETADLFKSKEKFDKEEQELLAQ